MWARLFYWGVVDKEGITLVLGCRIGKLSTSYESLPLRVYFKSSRVWDPMYGNNGKTLAT